MAARNHDLRPDEGRSETATRRDVRRRVVKTGAMLVPVILTLRATPAWAQTDYTQVAYRYGVNKGLCRNPKFNPNANPDSTAGQEFIECPDVPPTGRSGSPSPDSSTASPTPRTLDRGPRPF